VANWRRISQIGTVSVLELNVPAKDPPTDYLQRPGLALREGRRSGQLSPGAFQPYQTNVLFLLIGANPLPNYVAACLLAKPNATLYLLHSQQNGKNTYDVAERLKDALGQPECRPDLAIHLRGISRSDPDDIYRQIKTLLREVSPGADVGLNYTGGTKPMSVHVYHALRQTYPRGCFSYLDATSLTMIINRKGTPTQRIPVGRAVELDFQTLFGLHGYELKSPRQTATQPQFCRALAEVHSTSQGVKQWREWLRTFREPDPRLPTVAGYPALEPAIRGFADLCGGTPTETGVAQALRFDTLKSCTKFFNGVWLEEYTFDALAPLIAPLHFCDYGIALKPYKPGQADFDIDVAAMWGYQLFAISCMVTEKKDKAKEHLFEVFVRARQVGGDEARYGLICCVPNPVALQAEVEETWDAEGKIRVFGQDHLLDLPNWLEDWFRTANREV
jgi:hypothetical protein